MGRITKQIKNELINNYPKKDNMPQDGNNEVNRTSKRRDKQPITTYPEISKLETEHFEKDLVMYFHFRSHNYNLEIEDRNKINYEKKIYTAK